MDLVPVRGTASDLFDRWGDKFLRLDGDADDPRTWHPVKTVKDNFGDIDAFTVVFADGTPEKVFNGTDEVEFAVPRL
jgi:hypothetical protein